METEIELKGKTRRELQALCKRHGIPANLTNLEMAHLLSLRLQQNTEEEEEEAKPKKAKKVVKFSPEIQTFTYEQSEVCMKRRRCNGVNRKEPTPSVAGLRRSARLNNTLSVESGYIDEGPTTHTKMEMDDEENANAVAPHSQVKADVDTSDEIREKGECDTLSASIMIGSDDNVFSGAVDDGSHNLEMKKDDQWLEDKAIVAKVVENNVKLSSQPKFSLDISPKSRESYIGILFPLNASSPLGDKCGSLNAREDVTGTKEKWSSKKGDVAGNDDTNSCKVSCDVSDATNGPVKEHNSLTLESVEECDDKCQEAKYVGSENDVQEAGELIAPLPDNGVSGLNAHSVEVSNWEMNMSLQDGGESDVKIQHKLDVEASVGRYAKGNVNLGEDVEDNYIINQYENYNCEECDIKIQPELFVKSLKMDEYVELGLERKVVNKPVVEMIGDDGVGLERQVNEHEYYAERAANLIPDSREYSFRSPEAYIGICSPFGDMYRSPNVREEIKGTNKTESSGKGNSVARSDNLNSLKDSSDVSHGPAKEHNSSTQKSVEELLNECEDTISARSDSDLQEFGAFSDTCVHTLMGKSRNAEGCLSLPDDFVYALQISSEEVTSFEMNMKSQDGRESDVKIQSNLDTEEIEGRDAEENVMMNKDFEVGPERQVNGVAGPFVSENGEADIETQNECIEGDVLLNEDEDFGSVRELGEHEHHIGPIVEAASIGRDAEKTTVMSEDFDAGLKREVNKVVVSQGAVESELVVKEASRGRDIKKNLMMDADQDDIFAMKCENCIKVIELGQLCRSSATELSSVVKPEMCECSGTLDVGSGSVLLDRTELGDGLSKLEGVASFGSTENNDSLSEAFAKCTEMCESSRAIDVGSGSVLSSQTDLGDMMSKLEGVVASFGSTEDIDSLSEASAKCTEMWEGSDIWIDMAGTITLDAYATAGTLACESGGLADKAVSQQETVAFEKSVGYSESNGDVDALGEPMLECGAYDESRAVSTMNDNIGATMEVVLDATKDEAVPPCTSHEGVGHENKYDISNVEDAQMKFESVHKRATMESVDESAGFLSKKQGDHLHKAHDMKENLPSAKFCISALRNSAHRPPLKDLQKN